MSIFVLVCGALLVSVSNGTALLSGEQEDLYDDPVVLARATRNVYTNGGQFELVISADRSRVWINADADDIPGRGTMLKCRQRR